MNVSTFDLFKHGIGPSSSHTMGPMTAGNWFAMALATSGQLGATASIEVTLYGSLALTGRGHATDRAVLLGLSGFRPETTDPDAAEIAFQTLLAHRQLLLGGAHPVPFDTRKDIRWAKNERLPVHPNALLLSAKNTAGEIILAETYYSIGGGFVIRDDEEEQQVDAKNKKEVPFPFGSARELLHQAAREKMSIAQLMRANELALRTAGEVDSGLDGILAAMDACVDRGLTQCGELPGGLKVKRRAQSMYANLQQRELAGAPDSLAAMDWVNLWAMAVNEENAAGGRVVTAPTNGAAGIVPAVLRHFDRNHSSTRESRHDFLLTAGAIGALYKRNASISGAEVGCQGEVGVACSMAAGALAAVTGATNEQVENAAEIAMEHNLGLTCDPIGGLVQIPCIERNALGAIKAIDAARLALMGNGEHHVSLDKVIATMRRTGADMADIYKETSLGGLAVGFADC